MEINPFAYDLAGVDAATENRESGDGNRAFTINISQKERWISVALGGTLIGFGIRKGSWPGVMMILIGGNLLLRGALGRSLLYRLLGFPGGKNALPHTPRSGETGNGSFVVEKSLILQVPAEEAWRFWRNFENLPRVMRHLKSVRVIDDKHSHWSAQAPAGLDVEWDAEITDVRENRKIAWRSTGNAEVENKGVVLFEPIQDGKATEFRVYLEYAPPAGKAGDTLAKLFGKHPAKMVDEDLQRFKALMESDALAGTRNGRA